MDRLRTAVAGVVTLIAALIGGSLALVANADAAPTVAGVEWRELHETTGLAREQVATVCPVDGINPCAGAVGSIDLTGWVWATDEQARGLLDDYAPALSASTPLVSDFGAAIGFLSAMRWTSYTALTYFYSESNEGWTATHDPAGSPVVAGASYATSLTGSTSSGSIGSWSAASTVASAARGVWLWRPAGGPPPAPTSTTTSTSTSTTTTTTTEPPATTTIKPPPAPTCQGRAVTVLGTPGPDSLTGTAGVDVIAGLGGDDSITGLGGDDVICGDDGNDTVSAGHGMDSVAGGAGDDDLYGDSGNDTLDGGLGRDSLRGGSGADRCVSGEIRMSSC